MDKKAKIGEELFSEGRNTNRNRNNRQYSETRERHPRYQEEYYRKHSRRDSPKIIETKLFTSRDELVKYVNEKGQSDALIDIYKIEDELYKLVIKQ